MVPKLRTRFARGSLIFALVAASGTVAAQSDEADASKAPPLISLSDLEKATGLTGESLRNYQASMAYAAVIDRLQEVIGEQPGLAEIAAVQDQNAVRVSARKDWSSEKQGDLDEVAAFAGARFGIRVLYSEVLHGEDEIVELRDEVRDQAEKRGLVITSGGGHPIERQLSFAGPELQDNAAAEAVLQELTDEIVGPEYDVVIEKYEPTEFSYSDSRLDYGRPYRGGARIVSQIN